MNIPSLDYYNASTITHRSILKHYPEFAAMIDEDKAYKDLSWPEKLYRYYNHLSDTPRCPICGKPVKFVNFFTGYRQFCSNKCLGRSKDIQKKREETTERHYGVRYPMQNKDVMQKSIDTCIEKYGAERAASSDDVKKKIQETNINRYGCKYPLQNTDILNKYKDTCLNKYDKIGYNNREKNAHTCNDRYDGVGYASSEITNKIQHTCMEKYGAPNYSTALGRDNNPDFIGYSLSGDWICKCPHPGTCNKCNEGFYIISQSNHNARKKSNVELCTKLLPVQSSASSYELQIRSWLDEMGIKYTTNDRSIISPLELDIYIPSHKLAIEINGYYWHCDKLKSKNYHLDKWKACKEKGVQLLSIWEDWMINTPEKVRGLLESKLGIYEYRVMARQCKVVNVDSKTASKFLDANHIQGKAAAQYRYGLEYNGQLVSLMTFGKKRAGMGGKPIPGQYELARFCNLGGWQIVGGASRLQKHFIRDVHPDSILSWSSNDISMGNLYKKLGYREDGKSSLAYWYIYKEFDPRTGNVSVKRYHRYTFSKNQIIAKGLAPDTDKSTWTEREVMDSIPNMFRIYDSGTTRWILELNK